MQIVHHTSDSLAHECVIPASPPAGSESLAACVHDVLLREHHSRASHQTLQQCPASNCLHQSFSQRPASDPMSLSTRGLNGLQTAVKVEGRASRWPCAAEMCALEEKEQAASFDCSRWKSSRLCQAYPGRLPTKNLPVLVTASCRQIMVSGWWLSPERQPCALLALHQCHCPCTSWLYLPAKRIQWLVKSCRWSLTAGKPLVTAKKCSQIHNTSTEGGSPHHESCARCRAAAR